MTLSNDTPCRFQGHQVLGCLDGAQGQSSSHILRGAGPPAQQLQDGLLIGARGGGWLSVATIPGNDLGCWAEEAGQFCQSRL